MKRALPVAAIMLALICAGQTALAPAAHAEDQCQNAGIAEDVLSVQQQNDESILAGLGLPATPLEKTHGGRIPHCGERCFNEGASGGCIDDRGFRTQATCRNGVWSTFP